MGIGWIIMFWWMVIGLVFFVYAVATAKPYPPDLEDEEDRELEAKIIEYKKSQD